MEVQNFVVNFYVVSIGLTSDGKYLLIAGANTIQVCKYKDNVYITYFTYVKTGAILQSA